MSVFLEVNDVRHRYGKVEVLHGCSFSMQDGESLALLGESGSGKTTMLRLLAGFEQPSAGSIRLNGEVLAGAGQFVIPEKRDIGLVFQDYALFPHLSVRENIAIAMNGRDERTPEVWLKNVGLEGLGKRKPHELSGGQQQRVAIVRALATLPQLLLLDEPFSNIDESLKFTFRHELQKLLQKTGLASIFVTHDTKDALAIADRVVILKDGEVRQAGTPEEVYLEPADRYVAGLLAPFNRIREEGEDLHIIRAEHCSLVSKDGGQLMGTVTSSMFQGNHYLVNLEAEGRHWVVRSAQPPEPGSLWGIDYPAHLIQIVKNR